MLMLLPLLLLCAQGAAAPLVHLEEAPADWQLYPRGADGFGTVVVSGRVIAGEWDEVALELLGEDGVASTARLALPHAAAGAAIPFRLALPLRAICVDHEALLVLRAGARSTVAASWEGLVSGDVYLCQGQSNMVAGDYWGEQLANASQRWNIRSFGSASTNAGVVAADLNWHVADGETMGGPGSVGAWALRMAQIVVDRTGVPVALLNGAVGGTQISLHLRRESNPEDLNTIYGRLLWRARQARVAGAAKGLFWYQGESDGRNAAAYLPAFTDLHADWLQDFPSLQKIYVVQVRWGCGNPSLELRDLQRRLGDLLPKVALATANGLPGHDGCHFYYEGYERLGENMAMLVGRDYYGSPYVNNVESPNVLSAAWASPAHDEIVITFRQTSDRIVAEAGAELDLKLGAGDVVTGLIPVGNTLRVLLAAPSTATEIGYGSHSTILRGWITNARGVAALSFEKIPIQ